MYRKERRGQVVQHSNEQHQEFPNASTSPIPRLSSNSLNPNRSLDFGEIARLCHAACFSPSRRRSGLRRGVARNRMRTEAGKMPESLIFLTENSPGVSNDRFGLNRTREPRPSNSGKAKPCPGKPGAIDSKPLSCDPLNHPQQPDKTEFPLSSIYPAYPPTSSTCPGSTNSPYPRFIQPIHQPLLPARVPPIPLTLDLSSLSTGLIRIHTSERSSRITIGCSPI